MLLSPTKRSLHLDLSTEDDYSEMTSDAKPYSTTSMPLSSSFDSFDVEEDQYDEIECRSASNEQDLNPFGGKKEMRHREAQSSSQEINLLQALKKVKYMALDDNDNNNNNNNPAGGSISIRQRQRHTAGYRCNSINLQRKLLKKRNRKYRYRPELPPVELSHGICHNKTLVPTPPSLSDTKGDKFFETEKQNDQLLDIFNQEHKPSVTFQEKVIFLGDTDTDTSKANYNSWKKYLKMSFHKMKGKHPPRKLVGNASKVEPVTENEASNLSDDDCGSVVQALNSNSSSDYPSKNYADIPLPQSDEKNNATPFTTSKIVNDDYNEVKLDSQTLISLAKSVKKGDALSKAKMYEQATDSYLEAFNTAKSLAGAFPSQTLRKLLNRLNDVYYTISTIKTSSKVLEIGVRKENQSDYIRALKYYTIAYRLRRGALGKDHISLVIILNMLAEVQAKRNEFEEALLIHKMAQNITRKHNPKGRDPKLLLPTICLEESPHLFLPPPNSTLLRGEGAIYEHQGNLNKALELYHQSLRKSIQRKDIDTTTTTTTHSPTSIVELSRVDSLLSPSSTSSPFKFQTSFSLDNIETHLPMDSNDDFEVIYEPISMYNIPLTKDDIDIAITLSNIGHVQRRLGNSNIALQAYRSALHGMKVALGQNHSNVAALLGNIGNIYKEMGNYNMAIKIYKRVLRIESETLGANHAEITVTMHNMGTIEYCRKNYESAAKLFSRAMQIQNVRYGRNHTVVAVTANSLGEVYQKMNQVEKALIMYRESLRVCTKNLGKDHTDAAKLLYKIGTVYRDIGKKNVALKYCKKALELYELNSMEEEHPLITQITRDIANMTADFALMEDGECELMDRIEV